MTRLISPAFLKSQRTARILERLRHPLAQNALALYGVQGCRKFLPLICLPYLARTLSPAGWGAVAFVSSLAEFMVLTIEFGFNLSATREIAKNRHEPKRCGEIVSGVVTCQMLLAAIAVTAVLIASRWIPLLRMNPALLCAGLLYGVFQGLNPIWFFQGLERIRLAAAIEITGKLALLAGVFIFVRNPQDGWKALALQALPSLMTTAAGFWIASRHVNLCLPSIDLFRTTFLKSWRLFVYRSGESLYGVGNAFILGLFTTPEAVGYFAIADKGCRAISGLLNPIRDAIYPRLSHLAEQSYEDAAKLARTGALFIIGGGFALSLATFILARPLIHLLGDGEFAPAVTILRILAILPLLQSVTYSVGLQWLLPWGRDKEVNRIILAAGALNLILACALAPRFSGNGMAISVLCAELFVCVSMVITVIYTTSAFTGRPQPLSYPRGSASA